MPSSLSHLPRSRVDFEIIADLIALPEPFLKNATQFSDKDYDKNKERARVLDIGCGDGALLELLAHKHQIVGRGLELSQSGVDQCLSRGLSVIQGDADRDLVYYPNAAFDYVILSQTLQATHNPKQILQQMLRIGKRAIVSFPNFGYWRVRSSLFFRGKMPVTKELPYSWYDTPNIHFCTVRDFLDMVYEVDAKVEKAIVLDRAGKRISYFLPRRAWNLLGQQAVFLLHHS